jgi:hypothetical protein
LWWGVGEVVAEPVIQPLMRFISRDRGSRLERWIGGLSWPLLLSQFTKRENQSRRG